MGMVKKHIWVDLEQEGPDQEPDAVEIVAIAVPVLVEIICVCLAICCAIVWCGIGAGRI